MCKSHRCCCPHSHRTHHPPKGRPLPSHANCHGGKDTNLRVSGPEINFSVPSAELLGLRFGVFAVIDLAVLVETSALKKRECKQINWGITQRHHEQIYSSGSALGRTGDQTTPSSALREPMPADAPRLAQPTASRQKPTPFHTFLVPSFCQPHWEAVLSGVLTLHLLPFA